MEKAKLAIHRSTAQSLAKCGISKSGWNFISFLRDRAGRDWNITFVYDQPGISLSYAIPVSSKPQMVPLSGKLGWVEMRMGHGNVYRAALALFKSFTVPWRKWKLQKLRSTKHACSPRRQYSKKFQIWYKLHGFLNSGIQTGMFYWRIDTFWFMMEIYLQLWPLALKDLSLG